jgi:myo-inositol-1(or 4)-monophosphatase
MKHNYETYIDIVAEAGRAVLDFAQSCDFSVRDKGGQDPVTEADLVSNGILTKLQNELAGSSFLSEEAPLMGSLINEFVWIVDPVDGTREFVQGIPEYAVSVALVKGQKILFSAVYNPHESLEYQIEGERGSRCVSESTRACSDALCVSRSEWKRGLFEDIQGENFEPVGSVAFKLSLVAQGYYRGLISLCPKNEWDVAGGVGLVEAAGKTACDILGRKFQWTRNELVGGVLAGDDLWVREVLANTNLKSRFQGELQC